MEENNFTFFGNGGEDDWDVLGVIKLPKEKVEKYIEEYARETFFAKIVDERYHHRAISWLKKGISLEEHIKSHLYLSKIENLRFLPITEEDIKNICFIINRKDFLDWLVKKEVVVVFSEEGNSIY